MDLRDCSFRLGIDLAQQILPTGDGYLLLLKAREAILRARAEVSLWDDDSRREDALSVLRLFFEAVNDGQEQLFLRLDNYTEHGEPDAIRDLFALLGET